MGQDKGRFVPQRDEEADELPPQRLTVRAWAHVAKEGAPVHHAREDHVLPPVQDLRRPERQLRQGSAHLPVPELPALRKEGLVVLHT